MKLVVLESPFSASSKAGIDRNIKYARACMKDCLHRGEAPLASHLLYTQPDVLDDKVPEERKLGMDAGFAWTDLCANHISKVVVYTDRGISEGMQRGIIVANKNRIALEFRRLENGWNA